MKKKPMHPTKAVSIIKKNGGSANYLDYFVDHIEKKNITDKQKEYAKAFIENNCSKIATFRSLNFTYQDICNSKGQPDKYFNIFLLNIRKVFVEDKLFENIGNNKENSIMFALKNIFPEQYKADNERQSVNIDNRKLSFNFIKTQYNDMKTPQLIEEAEKMAKQLQEDKKPIIEGEKVNKDEEAGSDNKEKKAVPNGEDLPVSEVQG